jgi:hypothetical protein
MNTWWSRWHTLLDCAKRLIVPVIHLIQQLDTPRIAGPTSRPSLSKPTSSCVPPLARWGWALSRGLRTASQQLSPGPVQVMLLGLAATLEHLMTF